MGSKNSVRKSIRSSVASAGVFPWKAIALNRASSLRLVNPFSMMLSALSASAAPTVVLRLISLDLVESGEFQNSEESKVPMQKLMPLLRKAEKR